MGQSVHKWKGRRGDKGGEKWKTHLDNTELGEGGGGGEGVAPWTSSLSVDPERERGRTLNSGLWGLMPAPAQRRCSFLGGFSCVMVYLITSMFIPMLTIHRSYLGKNTEAEFLGVIGTKVLWVFLLDILSHLSILTIKLLLPWATDYAQKPWRNCIFKNSASAKEIGLVGKGLRRHMLLVEYSVLKTTCRDIKLIRGTLWGSGQEKLGGYNHRVHIGLEMK